MYVYVYRKKHTSLEDRLLGAKAEISMNFPVQKEAKHKHTYIHALTYIFTIWHSIKMACQMHTYIRIVCKYVFQYVTHIHKHAQQTAVDTRNFLSNATKLNSFQRAKNNSQSESEFQKKLSRAN